MNCYLCNNKLPLSEPKYFVLVNTWQDKDEIVEICLSCQLEREEIWLGQEDLEEGDRANSLFGHNYR